MKIELGETNSLKDAKLGYSQFAMRYKRKNPYRRLFAAILLVSLCLGPQLSIEIQTPNFGISTYLQDVRVGDSYLNIGFYLEDPWDNATLTEINNYALLAWAEDVEITSYPGRYVNWPAVTILVGWEDPETHTSISHNLGRLRTAKTKVDNGDWGANRIENEFSIYISQFQTLDPGESALNAWIVVRFSLSEYRGITNLDPHDDFDCNASIHLLGKAESTTNELMRVIVVVVIIFGGLAGVLVLLRLTKKR